MFELNESLTHIAAAPDRVISIISSLNAPDIMTQVVSRPEPTQAYVCAIQVPGGFEMYVYLYHQTTRKAAIFAWSEGLISREGFPDVEGAALEFTESMGFLMDNSHYRKKPPEERQQFYDALPLFRAELGSYAAELEAKEDPSLLEIEEVEEVEISAEAEGEEEVAGETAAEEAEEIPLEEAPATEPEAELQVVEFEEAPQAAPAAEPEAEIPVEIPVEETPAEEIEIDAANPFGELAVEEAEAAPDGEKEDLAAEVAALGEEEGIPAEAPAAEAAPFEDDDTGELAKELDDTIDDMILADEESAPPVDMVVPEAAALELETPPKPAAMPAPKPAPKPAQPKAAPVPETNVETQAAPVSLEEELLEPEKAPPEAPAMSEAEVRERLERIGRFLSSW